jgi:hypothetical protein
MTGAQFSAYLGVSPAAVSKALKSGALDAAVRWDRHGTKRVGTIVDVPRAVEIWLARPGARAPALEGGQRPAQPVPASRAKREGGKKPGPKQTRTGVEEKRSRAAAGDRVEEEDAPGDNGPTLSITAARLKFEIYRAKREQLDYEVLAGRMIDVEEAMRIFGRQIQEAKTAVMALGKHARSRIPHLTVDDVMTIEDLCREALEGLAAEAIQKSENPSGGET